MLKFLFYLCFLTLTLGQFVAVSKSDGVNFYIFDLFVVGFAILGLWHFLVKKSLFFPKMLIAFLPFTFIATLSLIPVAFKYTEAEFVVSAFYLMRWASYLVAALVVFNMLRSHVFDVKDVAVAIFASAVILCVLGFIQLLVLPDFEILDPVLGWDPHKNRLASTFFDPNFVGAYLNLCLSLVLFLLFEGEKQRQKSGVQKKTNTEGSKSRNEFSKPVLYFLFALFFISLILTFSRSAWVMFAVIIFVYGLLKSRIFLATALLVAFLAYFAVPRIQTRISGITDPADSAHFRFISWSNAWEIAKDNLFLGVGFNAFRFAQKEYGFFDPGTAGGHSGAGTDSSFLLALATTGVLGFILFVFGYLYTPVSAFFGRKSSSLLLISSFLGLLINAQFINSLFYPQIMWLWMILLVFAVSFDLDT